MHGQVQTQLLSMMELQLNINLMLTGIKVREQLYEQNARMKLEMKRLVTPTQLSTTQTHASTITLKHSNIGRPLGIN